MHRGRRPHAGFAPRESSGRDRGVSLVVPLFPPRTVTTDLLLSAYHPALRLGLKRCTFSVLPFAFGLGRAYSSSAARRKRKGGWLGIAQLSRFSGNGTVQRGVACTRSAWFRPAHREPVGELSTRRVTSSGSSS